MQLKASTDYALRTVLYLAINGGIYSSKEIASKIAVPRDYLIQLAQLLRNAGIIAAKAGKSGGYQLAKPTDQISFLDVVNAVDEGGKSSRSESMVEPNVDQLTRTRENDEVPTMVSSMHVAMDVAMTSYEAYLDGITIDMLVNCVQDEDKIGQYLSESLLAESKRLSSVS